MVNRSDLKFRFPTVEDLRLHCARRIPRIAFDYVDCAVGLKEACNFRNQAAFESIQLACRYGSDVRSAKSETRLFERTYGNSFGIAPMGLPSLVWPGGELALAHAAQSAKIPFVLGMVAGQTIEAVGAAAPDAFWFQMHRIPRDELSVNLDLAKRAEAAGAHALVLTIDLPSRGKRPRELRNHVQVPFRIRADTILDATRRPFWLASLLQRGFPSFVNFEPYVKGPITKDSVAQFVQQEVQGAFSWDEVAWIRKAWPRALVIKGILHPGDAEQAIKAGADAIIVSNHGGRQFESAPATVDLLPAICDAVRGRIKVFMDGGIRAGVDILKAMAAGADAVFAGRPFMYSLGAIGLSGPEYVIELLSEELHAAKMQVGARSPDKARSIVTNHEMGDRWRELFQREGRTVEQ